MPSIQNISKVFKKYLKNGKNEQKNLFSPWPKDGTFDGVACEDMERRIKDHKPRDKRKKRQQKRELELKVLNLFENVGLRHRRNLKEGVAVLKREQVEVDKINQLSRFKFCFVIFSGSLLCFQVLVNFLSCFFPCHLASL